MCAATPGQQVTNLSPLIGFGRRLRTCPLSPALVGPRSSRRNRRPLIGPRPLPSIVPREPWRARDSSRNVDADLAKMGAIRIGQRGEGDDDKSMEEDYLEWKDGMWEEFARVMGVEEGQGGDTPDFVVTEAADHPPEKVYLGTFMWPYETLIKRLTRLKVNFPPVLSHVPRVFTTQRTRTRRPSSFHANSLRRALTATASMPS